MQSAQAEYLKSRARVLRNVFDAMFKCDAINKQLPLFSMLGFFTDFQKVHEVLSDEYIITDQDSSTKE